MHNLLNFDKNKSIEEVIKRDLRTDKFILVAVEGDNFHSFITNNLADADLVYAIQTLKDRREIKFREMNGL